MRLKVTEADLKAALCEELFLSEERWERIQQRARHNVARRLLEENQAEQRRLIAESDALDTSTMAGMAAYLKRSDRLTRVFAEHDKLLELAYPRD